MGDLDGVTDHVFGERGDPDAEETRRQRRRRQQRRARAEAAAGTAGLVSERARRIALRRLNLRSCGLITGILVALAVIALVIATSGGGDDDQREAVSTEQPESSPDDPAPSDEESEQSGSGVRDAADGLLDVYVLTFEPVPGSCAELNLNGVLEVPPAELRVRDDGTMDVWLPWTVGNAAGEPVGELYFSGTADIDPDGSFVYKIDPTKPRVELEGQFDAESVFGNKYLYSTPDGDNTGNPCDTRPYTGTFTRTDPQPT